MSTEKIKFTAIMDSGEYVREAEVKEGKAEINMHGIRYVIEIKKGE
jgi:hypothetical protein